MSKRELEAKIAELRALYRSLQEQEAGAAAAADTNGAGQAADGTAAAARIEAMPEGLAQQMAEDVFEELVDQLSLGVTFEFHRMIKLGLLCPCSPNDAGHVHRGIVDVPGLDVFGRKISKTAPAPFPCPHCGNLRQAAKFASHLEKCMGMGGRESRRVAASRTRQLFQSGNGSLADGVEDSDTKPRKRAKKR